MLIILFIYIIQTFTPKIKRIKLIPFQKENQSSAFKDHEGAEATAALFKYDVTDGPTCLFDQLYFVAVVE